MDISRLLAIRKNDQQLQDVIADLKSLPDSSAAAQTEEVVKDITLRSQLLKTALSEINQFDRIIIKLALRSISSAESGLTGLESNKQFSQFLQLLFDEKLSDQQFNFLKSILTSSGVPEQGQAQLFQLQNQLKPDFLCRLLNSLPLPTAPVTDENESNLLLKQIGGYLNKLLNEDPAKNVPLLLSTWSQLFNNNQNSELAILPQKSFDNAIAEALLKLFRVSLSSKERPGTEVQKQNSQTVQSFQTNTNNTKALIEDISKSLSSAFSSNNPEQNRQLTGKLLDVISNMAVLASARPENSQGSSRLIATTALEIIKIAALLKSPEILSIAPQFLISVTQSGQLSNKFITDLMLPLYNLVSNLFLSAEPDDSFLLANYAKTLEKVLKQSSSTNSSSAENANRTASDSKSPQFANSTQAGKALLLKQESENYLKEILNRLNLQADKQSQPLFHATTLAHQNILIPLELRQNNPLLKEVEDDSDSKKTTELQDKLESLECSLTLPNLGPIGIKINLLGQEVSICLYSESERNAAITKSMLPELSEKLQAQGFKEPALSVRNSTPPPVKPEWMLKLLALNGKA